MNIDLSFIALHWSAGQKMVVESEAFLSISARFALSVKVLAVCRQRQADPRTKQGPPGRNYRSLKTTDFNSNSLMWSMDHTFTWIIGFTRTFHMVPTIAFIINIIIIIVGFLAKRAVLDIMEWVRPLGPDNSRGRDARLARPHGHHHHHCHRRPHDYHHHHHQRRPHGLHRHYKSNLPFVHLTSHSHSGYKLLIFHFGFLFPLTSFSMCAIFTVVSNLVINVSRFTGGETALWCIGAVPPDGPHNNQLQRLSKRWNGYSLKAFFSTKKMGENTAFWRNWHMATLYQQPAILYHYDHDNQNYDHDRDHDDNHDDSRKDLIWANLTCGDPPLAADPVISSSTKPTLLSGFQPNLLSLARLNVVITDISVPLSPLAQHIEKEK